MMDIANLVRDSIITTILALCAERFINRVKKWWYSEEDIQFNNVRIDFMPEYQEDEKMIITRKGKIPKFSNIFLM